MRVTPIAILASALVFSWAAFAAPKSESTRRKTDSDEEAAPARPKNPKPASTDDDEEKPKPKSTPSKKKTSDSDDAPAPARKPKTDSDSENNEPKPRSTPVKKKLADESEPATTPRPKTPKTDITEKSDTVKKKENEGTAAPTATPGGTGAPPAFIESSELARFQEQPEKVKTLIEAALALAKQGLTYKYGSDDPANGGMDCSGSIAYMLRQQGLKDVPRDASGQYAWARKNGKFFAVVSKKPGGFEFDDLQPGDLMFWSGTYSIDRDPPVTHTMIYLGEHKTRKQRVMWGSSDGRSYDGKSRYGVGVFDFKMPKTGGEGEGSTAVGNHPDFLGYARIPGLREAAKETEGKSADREKKADEKISEPEHKVVSKSSSRDSEEKDDAPVKKPSSGSKNGAKPTRRE